jgi:S1-C subfamily serine protease
MKATLLLVTTWLVSVLAGHAQAAPPEDSALKVFASVRYPNPIRPWANSSPVEVAGTATVIDGKRILTNAHLVLYASDVYVQPRRGGEKTEAKVEFVAPDMDLALLSIKDEKFFQNRPALTRAKKLPKVQDSVTVYGFPIGGNDLAVTKGVVSRIDFGPYNLRGVGLLVQVSAAINPGNSGGPAVVGDEMIGIVFSRLNEQQNIGYVIPNEEIQIFLDDIQDGRYDGKATSLGDVEFQSLHNPALRSFLKLDDQVKGVVVMPPRRGRPHETLQPFDVLTKIGEHTIDNEGMVQLPDDLRLAFYSQIPKLGKDRPVPVTLVRQGKVMETSLPVSRRDNRLIRDLRGERLPYFIHGPLVFAPARSDALTFYNRLKPSLFLSQSPLITREFDRMQFPGEELVVVTSPMFGHRIAKGYDDPVGQVVQEVNGLKIKNLHHLVETLRDSQDEFLRFRFAEFGSEVLVFRREEMNKVTAEILEDNGIAPTRRGSEDVMKLWKRQAAAP